MAAIKKILFTGGMPGGFPGGMPGGFPGGMGGMPGGFPGMGGMPGGMGGGGGPGGIDLSQLLSDPDLLAAFQVSLQCTSFSDVVQT